MTATKNTGKPALRWARYRNQTCLFACLWLWTSVVFSNQSPPRSPSENEIVELSLEDLVNVEITSVSRKAQLQSDAAAAIFVISNDDIKRSGVTNIPDALRMVPGLNVARLESNKWAISSRGFNDRFSNKLLVLIDGR
ncbi:MAG: Plug domain-containing protein, partial [Methylococcales bacterium]